MGLLFFVVGADEHVRLIELAASVVGGTFEAVAEWVRVARPPYGLVRVIAWIGASKPVDSNAATAIIHVVGSSPGILFEFH